MGQILGDCPVCGKKLNSGDDVVTCPECGAPYHRACYAQTGHCLFQEKHGPGFEYKTPQQEKAEAAGKEEPHATSGMRCKVCGTVNDARNIFCEKCGTPLHAPGPAATGPAQGGAQPGGVWPPQGGFAPGAGGPWGQGQAGYAPGVDTSGEIDGIAKKDWADYIGSSAPVYLPRLSQMSRQGTKFSFMFSAFLLGPVYFAYRKMWGWAALSLVLYLALQVPYYLLLMARYGIPPIPAGWAETLDVLSSVCSMLGLLVSLLTGIFALYLYRLHAGRQMKGLRQAHELPEDYRAALARKGGVSVAGAVVAVAVCAAFFIFFSWLTWDATLLLYNAYMNAAGIPL